MTRSTRVLLTILVCGSLLAATTVGVSVAAVYRAGSIAVEIQEDDGQQVRVAVPLAAVGPLLTKLERAGARRA